MYIPALILGFEEVAIRSTLLVEAVSVRHAPTSSISLPGEPSTLALAMIATAVISGYLSVMARLRPQQDVRQLFFARSEQTAASRRKAA
jgi:hypothetical protein